jgi:hypothetical protein
VGISDPREANKRSDLRLNFVPFVKSVHLWLITLFLLWQKHNFATTNKNMSRQIKLIWDFRGAAAAKTAEHHEIHLKQYIEAEKLTLNITGFTILNEMHSIAFMVVTDENMITVRDRLKPHRGELF